MKQVKEVLDWMIDNSDSLTYSILMDAITYEKLMSEYREHMESFGDNLHKPKQKLEKYRNLEFKVQDSITRYIRIV